MNFFYLGHGNLKKNDVMFGLNCIEKKKTSRDLHELFFV